MIYLQTPSFGCSFQDGRQLASKPAHYKQQVARSSPIFEISDRRYTFMDKPLNHIHQDTKSARSIAVCKRSFIDVVCPAYIGSVEIQIQI